MGQVIMFMLLVSDTCTEFWAPAFGPCLVSDVVNTWAVNQ